MIEGGDGASPSALSVGETLALFNPERQATDGLSLGMFSQYS